MWITSESSPTARVTCRYRFSASHRLHAANLSDRENQALYGRCNNPFGHGHNYELEVRVRGPVEERSGRAVDPAQLDRLVRRQVLERFDHRNLNEEGEEFQSVPPTSENLGRAIMRILKQNWSAMFPHGSPQLESVRLAETERNVFEVFSHEIE
jgi:6-pyruvoyltetrahydropterin/6-carboxytetrahydropterin synthase